MTVPKTLLVNCRRELRKLSAHSNQAKAGILLVNLGTPKAPTARALRPYLRQFLGDPRVVEVPRAIWWLILYGIILPFRAPRSARAYAEIWTEQGSPLLVNSQALADKLSSEIQRELPDVSLALAMSYGQPSIEDALERFKAENVQRLLVLPLYPQYSATTTGSVFDQVTGWMQGQRWFPELRFINDYYRETAWQQAVAESISDFRNAHGAADKLLFSFHGIPKRNLLSGDPYYCQCQSSARQIAAHLGLKAADWQATFQSRLGRAEWLKPYTDQTLKTLAKAGVRKLQVVCPGFAIDCLETLEEIAVEGRESFLEAGGQDLQYIPCLNDSDQHVAALVRLCRRHGQGWPEFDGLPAESQAERQARIERSDLAAETIGLQ